MVYKTLFKAERDVRSTLVHEAGVPAVDKGEDKGEDTGEDKDAIGTRRV